MSPKRVTLMIVIGMACASGGGAASQADGMLAARTEAEAVVRPLRIPVRVLNSSQYERRNAPVTSGIPLARESAITSTDQLVLTNAQGKPVPSQLRVLSRWGSPGGGPIRWVLVDWQADVPPRGSATYYLRAKAPQRRGPDSDQAPAGLSVRGQADRIVIDTGPLTLVVPKKGGYLFETLFQGATYRTAGLRVLKGKDLYHSGEAAPSAVVLEEEGPLRAVVRVEGTFRSRDGALLLGGDGRAAPNPTTGNPRAQGKPLEYTIQVIAFKGKPYLKVVATIENNGNGSWDGAWYPSNDVFFDGLYLDTTVPLLFPATITSGSLTAQVRNQQSFVLRQGHEVAHEYDESMNFFYETSIDGQRKTQRGRLPGWLDIRNREGGLTLAVRRFWQNYPKSIELADGVVSVGLWPRNDQDPEVGPYGKGRYFFSGGWHKTHEIMLAFSAAPAERAGDDPAGFLTPLVAQASPQWHVDSKGWGLIAPSGLRSRAPHLQPVLDRYERYQRILIDPEASSDRIDLERIRETRGYRNWFSCDWYGWEDFGDLMHGGNPCQPSSLIYDWPYIMWLQYVRSADPRFRTLAEEMTDHSRDLDQHHNEDTHGRPITAGNIVDGVWNWETGKLRGHHMNFNSAGNIISHTWNGGYALGYALTGNTGYLDAARRSAEAGRRFWAKAIAGQPIVFEETRSQGWSILMLVNLYKVTGERGLLQEAMQIFRHSLLYTEQLPKVPGSGGGGYIAVSRNPEPYYLGKIVATFATYHLEPLAELHWEAGQAGLDVAELEAFLLRSLDWLKGSAYVGGVCLGGGRYVPLTLSYATDPVHVKTNTGGTIGMNSLVAGLAGYAYLMTREHDPGRAGDYLGFARRLFRDLMYFKEVPRDKRDGSVDPQARSLITWSSWPFTAPKELGWIGRGGQPYLHVEYLLAEQGDAETPFPAPCR